MPPALLLLDNALDHAFYRPLAHWRRLLGAAPASCHVPAGTPLPPPGDHSHVILSGSEASITERAPWAEAELRWVRQAAARGVRLLGSCWGQQLIAVALGGPDCVRRSATPELGWQAVEGLAEGEILPAGNHRLFCSHFDEVIRGSHPQLRVLARSDGCAVQALRWGELPVWGIQAHPEMDAPAARRFLEQARTRWPAHRQLLDQALTTIPGDDAVAALLLARFLAS